MSRARANRGHVTRTGNSDVPDDYVDDGFRLGQWTGKQRNQRLHGKLDPSRVSRLEALSGWQWHRRDAPWEERFEHLQRFAESEGNARVPQSHIEGEFMLGQWVSQQRSFRRRGCSTPRRSSGWRRYPAGRGTPTTPAGMRGSERFSDSRNEKDTR
jgi:hypothetical protein